MFPCLAFGSGYWWVFPIIMIAMMVLCYFMMRGHGSSMMCGPGFGRSGNHRKSGSDHTLDNPSRKYAQGEINNQEYEEKKQDLSRRT